MDLTNQVPVLTASYLSLRISVNVQCRNEFHLGHFLKPKQMEGLKKLIMGRKETERGEVEWRWQRWKCILFIRLHDTADLYDVALRWAVVVKDSCSLVSFVSYTELIKWNPMFLITPHKILYSVSCCLFFIVNSGIKYRWNPDLSQFSRNIWLFIHAQKFSYQILADFTFIP